MEADVPLVVICMATFEPEERLFRQQIESIRSQTYENLLCLITDDHSSEAGWQVIRSCVADDPMFECVRADERVGFYRNFERVLDRVPADARYVALSDQDDCWYPDKLAVLVSALDAAGAELAYCDVRVVSDDGGLLSPTMWAGRPNNFGDLASLLIANTVTGAASVFRSDLLSDALPFPEPVGEAYHDQWLAAVALARGDLAYVDRPLQDYVRHASNVTRPSVATDDFRSGALAALGRLGRHPRRRLGNTFRNAGRIHRDDVLRIERWAGEIEKRVGRRIDRRKARVVHRLTRLSSSPGVLLWLLARSASDLRGRSASLGGEIQLAKGIVWGWLQPVRRRAR